MATGWKSAGKLLVHRHSGMILKSVFSDNIENIHKTIKCYIKYSFLGSPINKYKFYFVSIVKEYTAISSDLEPNSFLPLKPVNGFDGSYIAISGAGLVVVREL